MKNKMGQFAPKTSKHFANDPLYKRVVFIATTSPNTQAVADRLGVSKSTVYRWLKYGVSNKASNNKDFVKHVNRVSGALMSHRNRLAQFQAQKEIRPISYYRTHGGVRTKYWIVEGATYEQMLEIILIECMSSKYNAFYFLLKFDEPFTGYWDGDNARFYKTDGLGNMFTDEGDKIPQRNNKAVRDANSFVTVTAEKPFINTKLIQLNRGDCHPDRFVTNLYKFFHMKHFSIVEMRFNEIKLHNGKPINIYDENYYN